MSSPITRPATSTAEVPRTTMAWFQGSTSFPDAPLCVYEGDGFSNRLVAKFERAEDAAATVSAHNVAGHAATISREKKLLQAFFDLESLLCDLVGLSGLTSAYAEDALQNFDGVCQLSDEEQAHLLFGIYGIDGQLRRLKKTYYSAFGQGDQA